jgi:hypothetical protein
MKVAELMKTEDQGVPPPEPTVPESGVSTGSGTVEKQGELLAVMSEVKSLAERVGGFEKLREIIDMLASIKG